MTVPQNLADEILAKCGRHCCICRRFEPLHLQVNHIIPLSEGGTDDTDNLIPVCLTCHSDVHTQTRLTRRFSAEELKQDRDMTFRLVEEGKLPSGEAGGDALDAS
jgi:5-methylcytosine-specific restriction endonuclease McrA